MLHRTGRTLMLAGSILAMFALLPEAARAQDEKAANFDFNVDWTSALTAVVF